jgi:adenosylcobinamide-phosphate synthase
MLINLLLPLLLALALDYFLGEPKRFHPLVGFGHWVNWLECLFTRRSRSTGVLAWCIAVLPCALLTLWVDSLITQNFWQCLFNALLLYLALGWCSLLQHARAIAEPLAADDLDAARQAVAMIVSRDVSAADKEQIATAATESVLENGADAIFAALFWFAVAGPVGVLVYRLANTLDAMWGYRNERYRYFGWAAARIDDVFNFIPARLTALSYCLLGNWQQGRAAWLRQGANWKSPNAGPVMAAGAGALGVRLGGSACYHGEQQLRPILGDEEQGAAPTAATIQLACALLNRSLLLWVVTIITLAISCTIDWV